MDHGEKTELDTFLPVGEAFLLVVAATTGKVLERVLATEGGGEPPPAGSWMGRTPMIGELIAREGTTAPSCRIHRASQSGDAKPTGTARSKTAKELLLHTYQSAR